MSNSSFIKNRPCISKHFISYCSSLVALELDCLASDVQINHCTLYCALDIPILEVSFCFRRSEFKTLRISLTSDTFCPLNVNLIR